jgi:cell wall-associated NlpC family hydrolase
MNQREFINKIIGTPWVNRAYGFDGCDCFGLVYLYFYKVKGVMQDLTPEYLNNKNFSDAFQAQLNSGSWIKVDRPAGDEVVFMCFNGDMPMHCGVMINRNEVLHSFGSVENPRQVCIWTLKTMISNLRRYYKMNENPRVEFYKWEC